MNRRPDPPILVLSSKNNICPLKAMTDLTFSEAKQGAF
jgi:hypothetical protein